jgi:hypothetical protein
MLLSFIFKSKYWYKCFSTKSANVSGMGCFDSDDLSALKLELRVEVKELAKDV